MDNVKHRAGQKIADWRARHDMTRRKLGELLGDALECEPLREQTIYNWEVLGKDARPQVRRVLADMGICLPEDWCEPLDEAA